MIIKFGLISTALVSLALGASCIEKVEKPQRNGGAEVGERQPLEMAKFYVVFLRRGPKWTTEITPEIEEIISQHMAHINTMAESEKLVLAGPFLEQSGPDALAGLFIFKVDSIEQAIELTEADAGVKSGRFVYEIVPWFGPKNMSY